MNIPRTGLLATLLAILVLSAEPVLAHYDPGTQRWLNRDPLEEEGSINLFCFVDEDPISYVDTFGDTIFKKLTSRGIMRVIRNKTAHMLIKKGYNLCASGGRRGVTREMQKALPNRETLYHDRDGTAKNLGGPHAQPKPRRGNNTHLFRSDTADLSQMRDAARNLTAVAWVNHFLRDDQSANAQGLRDLADFVDDFNPLGLANDFFEIGDDIANACKD